MIREGTAGTVHGDGLAGVINRNRVLEVFESFVLTLGRSN